MTLNASILLLTPHIKDFFDGDGTLLVVGKFNIPLPLQVSNQQKASDLNLSDDLEDFCF